MSEAKDGIRVVVRLKPPKNAEGSLVVARRDDKEVHVHSSLISAQAARQSTAGGLTQTVRRFTFDDVFHSEKSQGDLYSFTGSSIVGQVLEGFNATILSYGQTGSGKTHTMVGPNGGVDVLQDGTKNSEVGVIPRFLEELFEKLMSRQGLGFEFSVLMGVVELYNEALRDLGPPTDEGIDLRIREDRSPEGKGIYVEGMSMKEVATVTGALHFMHEASARKSMGSTRMNESSSRSHTIVVLNISQIDKVRHNTKTRSQVFLVDLAGSERVDKTGAVGERLKEAQNINLSLTLLGNVISKLTDGKSVHIPYRDAKLTRLLQDSLGGNSITTLICTCSMDVEHLPETLSTLQFAHRAKSIKNRPTANVVRGAEELHRELIAAKEEITSLQRRLRLRDQFDPVAPENPSTDDVSTRSLLLEIEQLREELRTSQNECSDTRQRLDFHISSEQSARAEMEILRQSSIRDRAAAEAALSKLSALLSVAPSPPAQREFSRQNLKTTTQSVGRTNTMRSVERRPIECSTSINRSTPVPSPIGSATESAPTSLEDEARSLVRERMLLSELEKLKSELSNFKKFSILVDRERSENDELKVRHARLIDELTSSHDAKLLHADQQILALRSSLDAAELTIKSLQAEKDSLEKNQEQKDVSAMQPEVNRLVSENKELHTENRINAMRMSDLAKRIDTLESENRRLQDDRETMRRDIEMYSMEDGSLKKKLLALLTRSEKDKQQERSYFRRRLLDCFSSD